MSNWPQPFRAGLRSSDGHRDDLVVDEVLRCIPGRRWSVRGRWREQPVFAKIFMQPNRSTVHLERELKGFEALRSRDIPTATLLAHGRLESAPQIAAGADVAVYEWLEGAESLIDRASGDRDVKEIRSCLEATARLLRRHHDAGVRQKDLHFGNFACFGDFIYTLDQGSIEGRSHSLPRRRRRDNLVLFLAQIDPRHDSFLPDLLDAYQDEGDDRLAGLEPGDLWPELVRTRKRRIRRFLEKVERTSRLCRLEDHEVGPVMYSPELTLEGRRLVETLLDRPSEVAWTCPKRRGLPLVTRLGVPESDALRVLRFARGREPFDRARRAWRNAHRLRLFDVPTPRALARATPARGDLAGESLLFFSDENERQLEAEDLDGSRPAVDRLEDVVALLARLDELGLEHRRLTPAAIVAAGGEARLDRLDRMRDLPARAPGATGKWTADMERYVTSWQNDTVVEARLRAALERLGYRAASR